MIIETGHFSGMCTGAGPKYVHGGRFFVLPVIQKAQR